MEKFQYSGLAMVKLMHLGRDIDFGYIDSVQRGESMLLRVSRPPGYVVYYSSAAIFSITPASSVDELDEMIKKRSGTETTPN